MILTRRAMSRRDGRRFVRDLGLPAASGIRELLPAVEELSGCPIRVLPAPTDVNQGLCGMWVRTIEDIDYIFVHEKTSRAHQDHILAHELAHILCNHRGSGEHLRANPVTSRLATSLDPAVMARAFSDCETRPPVACNVAL